MASLDMDAGGRAETPAPRGWRMGPVGLWLMGAYWLAMLAVLAIGASASG